MELRTTIAFFSNGSMTSGSAPFVIARLHMFHSHVDGASCQYVVLFEDMNGLKIYKFARLYGESERDTHKN
jgi:hypothetical protein